MLFNKLGLYILAKASWIIRPFYSLSLLLDGIVYTVVAYAYKIFILMAQIKFSEIYKIMEPLIDRVKALIMVLVMFKLGKSLIEYMIDPAKATDKNVGGAALVKNIAFTAALLILYPFIFGVMSDISLLIIGGESGSYEYLGKLVSAGGGSDTGLLARFIWGSDVSMDDMDVGTWLAHQTYTIFLHDISSDGSGFNTTKVDFVLKDGDGYVFTKAHELVDEIDVTVEYTLPFVSTIMGLYLIYSLGKVAIEIGVRMFKMIILQILAPLAIITIIDKGTSSPTFKTFCKTYISVFLEAITRIAIVFIVTTFVGSFMQDITVYFNNTQYINENVLTRGLICIVVLVAGYRLVGILPKFIDQALGTNMAGSASGGGFGKFAAGLVGGAIGLGTGLAAGVAGGAGFFGTAGNMLSGAVGGYQAGGKGKNVADFFKNQSANTQASRDRAARIARQGGGLAYAGSRIENALGIPQAQAARAQRQSDTATALDNMMNARMAAISEIKDGVGPDAIKFGSSADDYASRKIENDTTVQGARLEYENTKDVRTYNAYMSALKTATDRYKNDYNTALFNSSEVNSDKNVLEATRVYDRRSDSNFTSRKLALNPSDNVKKAKNVYAGKASNISNRGASRRANRQNIYGGK